MRHYIKNNVEEKKKKKTSKYGKIRLNPYKQK